MPSPLAGVARFPRARLGHAPTPIDAAPNLGAALGIDLYMKRDDCTGLAFGGNKVRQLEFHFGEARARGADTVLVTGAVQSNLVRIAAAAARRLGMEIHIQIEDRVEGMDETYRISGNLLLDRVLGATLHPFPEGEDEAAADAAMEVRAAALAAGGRKPYVIRSAPGHPPLGGLGYVAAAGEIADQSRTLGVGFDAVVCASGSALTHAGLLVGLRALGERAPVLGICVRRDAASQGARVARVASALAAMIERPDAFDAGDVDVSDAVHPPGYGRLNEPVREAMALAARHEGLLLEPAAPRAAGDLRPEGLRPEGLIGVLIESWTRPPEIVRLRYRGTPWSPAAAARTRGAATYRTEEKGGGRDARTAGATLPRIPAGRGLYARTLYAVDSDYPGPVLLELLEPPLAGAVAAGQFSLVGERLVLRLTRLEYRGRSVPVDAWAVGLDCACYGVEGEVDRHWFERVLLPSAVSFAEGFLTALGRAAESVIVGDGDVRYERREASTGDAVNAGLATAARTAGDVLLENAPDGPTVRIAEALHFGHSPAGIGSPGWTRSQAFFSGPHSSAGPFQLQYWQVAVGIMVRFFRCGVAFGGGAACRPSSEGQSLILMCSPQGGGCRRRSTSSDQSAQMTS